MKILLLGKNGQVGWELQRALAPLGDVIALDRETTGALHGDLSRPDSLARTLRSVAPAVIVNAAAYTAVDRAQSEPDTARQVNGVAPAIMAREAASLGACLVQYSTDYVFDGSGSAPWTEDSPTGPLNVYGHTKLEGETAIRASGCRHLIFRTSWVYAARGNNFARTLLRHAAERDALSVVDDQFGAPTGAELLADVTAFALRAFRQSPDLTGTYHLAASGETTWHGYACHVLDFAHAAGKPLQVSRDAVRPIPGSEYPTPAARPRNSRLDTTKLRRAFNLTLPDWTVGVDRMLTEVLNPASARA